MDFKPYLNLKLFDLTEAVTVKGLSAELHTSIEVAANALREYLSSLTTQSPVPNLIYYYLDTSKDSKVILKYKHLQKYQNSDQIFAISPDPQPQSLIECDIPHLLHNHYPIRIKEEGKTEYRKYT